MCNVPAYSTDAVAQLVMTHVLNFSASVHLQQRRTARGDRSLFHGEPSVNKSAFEAFGEIPHFELAGKTIGLVGGTGAIGARTAEMARAFGMDALVWAARRAIARAGDGARPATCATFCGSRISCPCTAR